MMGDGGIREEGSEKGDPRKGDQKNGDGDYSQVE